MVEGHCGECAQVCRAVAEPRALLLCATLATVLWKCRGCSCRLRLRSSEPAPGTLLLSGCTEDMERFLVRLLDVLADDELDSVRGTFFSSVHPGRTAVAGGLLGLTTLDSLLERVRTRWFCRVLQGDALFTAFQPLVSLGEKRIVAHESLLRARLDGEEIGAEPLLAAARSIGLQGALGATARRLSILQGRGVLKGGGRLFVNFEPETLRAPEACLADLEALCREADVDMDRLVFEVVETENIQNLGALREVLDGYRRRGARVALDDMGSGYSSFRYLVELKPDYVKLDRHLVHGALNDRTRSVLLRALTGAARDLGIGVIAEGVESEEDLRFCLDAGIDFAQGYFLARPAERPPRLSSPAASLLNGVRLPA